MTDQAPTPTGITTRESLAALAYFTLHLAFSFWSPGSEMRNYLTLVAGPLFLVVFLRAGDPPSRHPSPVLASFGLRRDNLRAGLGWAVIIGVLLGLFHVPFAYLNPNWPTAGDLPAALQLGMVEGGLGGIILGAAYVLWKRNLVACIVLHGMIDAVPIMTMIKFGGSGGG